MAPSYISTAKSIAPRVASQASKLGIRPKHVGIAAGLGSLYYAYRSGAKFTPSMFAERSSYISSSTLGITKEQDLLARVYNPKLGDFNYSDNYNEYQRSRSIMSMGNQIHADIQSGLVNRGIAKFTEKYVEDPKNQVFGYIDAVLAGGVPLEIKSINQSQFSKLTGPKPEHISQANFYALAQSSPTALIMYVSREDTSQRKLFAINADPGRYEKDIQTVRNVQSKIKGLAPKNPYLSGFRPLSSWFGGGINYNMPYSHRSKIGDQRGTLSTLPISMHMAQQPHYNHPNASRAGI